jgi:hypothetical protein
MQRINFLGVALGMRDISRFVADADSLKIWSREYFYQLAQRITNHKGLISLALARLRLF